jgi:hypothetical protein
MSRPTINPYRNAIGEIIKLHQSVLNRLLWDVNPLSKKSRKKLQDTRNKYKGEKCVILCNGPSLLKTDFNLLKNVFTFGLNKINLLFEKNDFRPSFIAAVNRYVIEQNCEFYNETEIPLFLDSVAQRYIKPKSNITFLHSSTQQKFAEDCSRSIQQGATVTFVALQLACHMGFRDVALVGCDHNFATKGTANKTVKASGPDQSHFDPNYFAHGATWQLPDLARSEIFYIMAREAFAKAGGRVVNCTEGGTLGVYERSRIKDWTS